MIFVVCGSHLCCFRFRKLDELPTINKHIFQSSFDHHSDRNGEVSNECEQQQVDLPENKAPLNSHGLSSSSARLPSWAHPIGGQTHMVIVSQNHFAFDWLSATKTGSTSENRASIILKCYVHVYTYTHACIRTYIHKYIHTHMHTYSPTCIHIYIHTYVHAHMHTCTHRDMDRQRDISTSRLHIQLHCPLRVHKVFSMAGSQRFYVTFARCVSAAWVSSGAFVKTWQH
jgi:hypothetical protein